MVPRRPKEAAKTNGGLKSKFQEFLRIKPDPIPAPVDATEDLVAIKCNLCSDRVTLNPPGASRRA
jgi:hypothetical protein